MQSNDLFHIHDTFKGQGGVYKADERIADVEYSMKYVEEKLPSSSTALPKSSDSKAIYGLFRSPARALLAGTIGDRLTLHLQDGRRLQFTVVKDLGDSVLIQGLSAIEP